jgi:hypothetical protein
MRPVEEDAVIRRSEVIAALFLVGAPCLYGWQSAPEVRPHMTLVQCDMIGVPNEIRLLAKAEVIRIFSSAGVDIIWIDAEAGCKTPSVNRAFMVIVMSEPPEAWGRPNATGFAPVRTGAYRRAYVFYPRVTAVAKVFSTNRLPQSVGVILGHAIAHELGHLLIPGDAHTPNGIMHDQWNYRLAEEAAAGRLLFTSDQSQLIQKELRSK